MSSKNLVILDDEKELLSTLEILLDDVTESIVCQENGKDGLDYIEANLDSVDLIISDINMPIMNGVEFIKSLRAKNILTPVIFYTAHGNEELMNEVVQYGVYDFLNKPNFDGLEDAVVRCFDDVSAGRYSLDESDIQGGENCGADSILEDLQKL